MNESISKALEELSHAAYVYDPTGQRQSRISLIREKVDALARVLCEADEQAERAMTVQAIMERAQAMKNPKPKPVSFWRRAWLGGRKEK